MAYCADQVLPYLTSKNGGDPLRFLMSGQRLSVRPRLFSPWDYWQNIARGGSADSSWQA